VPAGAYDGDMGKCATLGTSVGLVALLAGACDEQDGRGGSAGQTGLTGLPGGQDGGSGDSDGDGSDGGGGTDGGGGATDSNGGDSDGSKFDVGGPGNADDGAPNDTCGTECECVTPEHIPCDAGGTDVFNAIGLNCAGEVQATVSTAGPPSAIGVRTGFGNTNTWAPTEGSSFAVIGSGLVAELNSATPAGDFDLSPTHCNDDLGAFDPGGSLPAPLRTNNVGASDCNDDPTLVGSGDCSNTIAEQFDQGGSANDYVEMRVDLDVPDDVVSISYDFAFFSTEWPAYAGSEFNDMYVGWLESENWTGNISFDGAGNPISLNAGFLEYTDQGGGLPELAGTCMARHAGTGWLSTTVGVTPGESITVVFAIFDLSDSILDSYAFIDNFQLGCEPQSGPVTMPEG